MWLKTMAPGVLVGERVLPIGSVAGYVPRGKGAFPSVAIMVSVPAVVAGVPRPILLTPPLPDGSVDAATLFVAREAGIAEVYKVGGAQAVAAVAYGTQTVPRCDKIVGPGSPWLGAARRLLADVLDPGMPAGPSESIVFADATANVRKAALDLVTESEHGSDSSSYLVTTNEALGLAIAEEVARLWDRMGEPWATHSRDVLTGARGGLVLAADLDDVVAFVNAYAPEHLLVASRDPWPYLSRFRHAGEILLGENVPFGVANYVLGANNVLPTSGHARTPLRDQRARLPGAPDHCPRRARGLRGAARSGQHARHLRRLRGPRERDRGAAGWTGRRLTLPATGCAAPDAARDTETRPAHRRLALAGLPFTSMFGKPPGVDRVRAPGRDRMGRLRGTGT